MCIVLLCVCIAVLHTLVAGLLARSPYPKVLRLTTSAQVFLGFPDGSQGSKLLLHASHAGFPTFLDTYIIFMSMHFNHCHPARAHL
jgi:hypothetical protein